jgi:threonyl-tRNA synthetase
MTQPADQLFRQRHSLAHLLAMAVLKIDPEATFGTGPVTESGFYYDILLSNGTTISDKDFNKLEKSIRGFIAQKLDFTREEVSADQARELFKDQPFKLELIEEIIARGEAITIYRTGGPAPRPEDSGFAELAPRPSADGFAGFTDLCEGPHVANTSEIPSDSFTIHRLAGAYWKANEANQQLLRVAGLAFESKEALDHYLWQQEEAKKRDHRKLGKELGLFIFSDLVGAGLPLWTPKGTLVREALDNYVWELRRKNGFQKVTVPHITKKDLYETSGHWQKFAEELFKIRTREDHVYAMKPMNCPHHAQIFAAEPHSYREMPQRYAETTMVYRDEQSGELSGLSRVLSITQDDAHVFCRESQIEEEVFAIWNIIDTFYGSFGFTDLQIRFSRHDNEHFEKYLGTREIWEKAEDSLRRLIEKRGLSYVDGKGEAAMYGPKIDFITKDSLGRTLQVATIQLDFNQPKNFGLSCINEKGEKEPVVMIHCAIMGSIERFMATLIEHTAGNFPLWLAPEQVWVLPISEAHHDYAAQITEQLKQVAIRAHLHDEDGSLGKKIRQAKLAKIPYFLVIGDQEVQDNTVTLESRDRGKIGTLTLETLLAELSQEIKEKK